MAKKKAPFKLLICIVDKAKSDLALQILNNAHENIGISNIVFGVSKMGSMDIMSLGRKERIMLTSLVRTNNVVRTIQALDLLLCPDDEESFGMAFSIPLTSASRDTINYFTPKRREE